MLYGHHTGGLFGYSHLTGGWDGGQAEYARVPFGARPLTPCWQLPVLPVLLAAFCMRVPCLHTAGLLLGCVGPATSAGKSSGAAATTP
jgi:threonine dehydrogenase-like Zn-dependent dehydrogenase